jgi:hypothetical protein
MPPGHARPYAPPPHAYRGVEDVVVGFTVPTVAQLIALEATVPAILCATI